MLTRFTTVRLRGNILAPAVVAAALLQGCDSKSEAPKAAPPPAQIEAYVTKAQTVPVSFDHTGQITASQKVDVRARLTGVLVEQGFTEGTTVTKGQFLYRIDPRTFEADVRVGSANVLQAQANVQAADRDLKRSRTLASTKAISQEEVDNALTKYETSVAAQKLAEANLYKAQVELTYTTVTAPISGKVGRAEKRPGDLVDTTNNSLLCTITTQDPIWVEFFVSEREMLDYRRNVREGRVVLPENGKLTVDVTLLDGTPYAPKGEISFFDVKIDPQTGTALVRAELPNPEGQLVPGQFVKAHVRGVTRPNLVLVPQAAVQQGMQGTFVYVTDDKGQVEMRPIKAGSWEGSSWIVESGLKPGEMVITGGLLKVRPGATVQVTTVTRTLPPEKLSPAAAAAMQTTTTASQPGTDSRWSARPTTGTGEVSKTAQ
jgi:membrane fusion protein (multidrug efflux system)